MKLITLNIWGGHVQEPLLEFARRHQDIDIFCLQEVYHNAVRRMSTDDRAVHFTIFSQLQEALPDHRGFFKPALEGYGIGMLVKNSIEVLDEGDISIYDNPHYEGRGPTHPRILQWLKCREGDDVYTILNVHGLWNGKGKTDSPERLAQSQKIREFMDKLDTPIVLCGDFNLRPDTVSLKMVADGMHNLIQHYSVTSTRTHLYDKQELFADYIFTSPEIPVHTFEVLPDIVSDHAPLLLKFGLPKDALKSILSKSAAG